MARSPITSLIDQFNALTEEQQKLFLDMVAPEPEQPTKQRRQRRTRSPRAQSISAAIAKTPKVDVDNGAADEGPKCGICGQPVDHSDHDPTYLSSHVFEAPKSAASSAKKRSGRKSAGTGSIPSTEGETVSATAVGASGD